jgi:hypothetical protein
MKHWHAFCSAVGALHKFSPHVWDEGNMSAILFCKRVLFILIRSSALGALLQGLVMALYRWEEWLKWSYPCCVGQCPCICPRIEFWRDDFYRFWGWLDAEQFQNQAMALSPIVDACDLLCSWISLEIFLFAGLDSDNMPRNLALSNKWISLIV